MRVSFRDVFTLQTSQKWNRIFTQASHKLGASKIVHPGLLVRTGNYPNNSNNNSNSNNNNHNHNHNHNHNNNNNNNNSNSNSNSNNNNNNNSNSNSNNNNNTTTTTNNNNNNNNAPATLLLVRLQSPPTEKDPCKSAEGWRKYTCYPSNFANNTFERRSGYILVLYSCWQTQQQNCKLIDFFLSIQIFSTELLRDLKRNA